MQSTNQPAKILIPFAQNDSAKVEIPATTADATRFSQSLGSPPLTGMPPEAGGVPPQLEDFNGAMNQQSRLAFWGMAGGRFPYDSVWANDTLIQGYPRGAVLPAAIGAGLVGMGEWYNNTEGNTIDPDGVGTGWVPGYHYGTTALTGQSGGTVTLTPAQAGKRVITVSGTLTSNLVLVLPAWIYSWRIVNNTGGAFFVTAKNAATAAVDIPQNGAPTIVNCDGTQVSLDSPNIAPTVAPSQAMQYGQATGRLLGVRRFTASGSYTKTAGTRAVVVEMIGGGGGGSGTAATGTNQMAVGGGGGGGPDCRFYLDTVPDTAVAVTVGAGGTGTTGAGGAGAASSFGSFASAPGGTGGNASAPVAYGTVLLVGGGTGGATPGAPTGGAAAIVTAPGSPGRYGLGTTVNPGTYTLGGDGGNSALGGGGQYGAAAANSGGGGGGVGALQNIAAQSGGAGGSGLVVIYEYA